MVLAPLDPGFGEGAAAGQRSARPQGTSLDGRPPVSRPGLLFGKLSHQPTAVGSFRSYP
jgi:hypothetical protein